MDTRYAEATGTLQATLMCIRINLEANLEVSGSLNKRGIEELLEYIAEQEEKVVKITDRPLHAEQNAV